MNKCSFCGNIITQDDLWQTIIGGPMELIVCDKRIKMLKLSRNALVEDGGDLLLGTLEDAFYAGCFYPCNACAGDNILEEDFEMLEPCA